MTACFLTTVDNKYDPFIDFDSWYDMDTNILHYDTCGKVARFATMFYGYSDEMTDEQQHTAIENAIDDIISIDILNIYRKIKKEEPET